MRYDLRDQEQPVTVDWGDGVPALIRERQMGFVIGNGLSRLSGAPSWPDLFATRDVVEVLEREGVSRDTPYLELGYLLEKRAPLVWDRVLRRLYDWGHKTHQRVSHAHRVLLEVLQPVQPSPPHVSILTTNVDPLLENYGYHRDHIGYLHGDPHPHTNWIFTANRYWDSWRTGQGASEVFKRFQANGVLFLGYGHSHEDFDIVQTVIELRKLFFGRMFTLMTEQEASRGELRCRLDWQGIQIISYNLPLDPTPTERDVFLTRALLDLAVACGFDRDPERSHAYDELRAWCDAAYAERRTIRSRASIVLGLAGVNRHAALPGAIPSSDRRVAESAEIRIEAGGPGFIVAQIGRATGMDSFLVTKVATDECGSIVQSALGHPPDRAGARIFSDFVERVAPGPGVNGFRTWDSFILEPKDHLSHRVFIDRAVDARSLDLSEATRHAVATLLRDGADRVFYFDRHYRDSIVHILRSANYDPIADGVWTVYETDSDGGRYGLTPPGAGFDTSRAYDFEKRLAADQLQCINVVVASFRFARDCLAAHYGGMSDADYQSLISIDDSEEIVGGSHPVETEDAVIARLVRCDDRLHAFAAAVRKGADRFLRKHALRLVVVTLHRHGALALTVPHTGEPIVKYVPGIPIVSPRLYTASAGDVFRGALVSALTRARRAGLAAEDLMDDGVLTSIVDLCNRCAAAKVAAPTLNDCLADVAAIFANWAAQLPAPEIPARTHRHGADVG
jgi:sugar/nucleoside kinase (ribokinase family)